MPDAPLRVFISYARTDSTPFVDRLEQSLKAHQFQPWVDRHGLEGGDQWMDIIQQAIDDCHALVVVLSPAAVQSKFVRIEYRYADEIGKLVIPLRYLSTTTTPMDLRILHWVDFQSGYEEGLRQLIQSLSRLKPPAAPPAPLNPQPKPPPAPAATSKTKKQWLDESEELRIAGRFQEALAATDQATMLDPNYANAYYSRGSVLQDWQRNTEALVAFDQAIRLDPTFAIAYNGRGNALRGLQRHTEALVAFDYAIQLNPTFGIIYYNRGAALHDLQRNDEALAAFDQAISLAPTFALAYEGRAWALDSLGRKQEAEQARKKARELGFTG